MAQISGTITQAGQRLNGTVRVSGRGIDSVDINDDGYLVVTYTDGEVWTSDEVIIGNGIESIELTSTSGAVKTYTITFTDGTTTTFDVTDGEVTNEVLEEITGDLADLDTEDKDNLVDAINEVYSKIPVMTKEVTGNPIVVGDAQGAVDSLTVDVEPAQDLHGYDKPWAPGANKNIINVENPMVFTETKEVVFDEPIPSGETVYIYRKSYEYTTEPSAGPKYPVVVFYNGSTAIANVWISPDSTKSYKLLPDQVTKVVFFSNGWNYSTSSGVEVTVNDLMFSLTEEDSYTPYSNVCPITGHDSVDIVVQGKNLLPFPYTASGTTTTNGITWRVNNDGSIDCSGTATSAAYLWLFGGSTTPVPAWIEAGETYAVSCGNGTPVTGYPRLQMILYGSTNIAVTEESRTMPDDLSSYTGFAVVLQVISGATVPSGTRIYPQVEIGSTPTVYEPYRSQATTTVTLPSTVYGGTVGATSGTGQVTKGYIKLNTADMNNSEDYPGWKASGVRDIIGGGFNGAISNGFTNVSPTNTNAINANTVSTNDIIFLSKAYFGLTQTDWKALAMDIEFLIPRATPTALNTTPTAVTLFNGGNIVSSDGFMDMVYVRDIVKIIESLEG